MTPALLLVLCACNQALFDKNIDEDDPGQTDDGADGSGPSDGSGTGDSGVADDGGDGSGGDGSGGDGSGGDGSGGDGDGGEVACTEPCQGDPVADFALEQGGTNDRWFYLADRGDPSGTRFDELRRGTFDSADAWVIEDDVGPAILNCADFTSSPACAGAGDSLLLIPSSVGDGHPVLAFRAPTGGTYRLAGSFRTPQAFEVGVVQQFLVSRNARHDLLRRNAFVTTTASASFSVDVEALAGDQIHLTLLSRARGSGGAIAFDFTVTLLGGEEDIFPGRCMFAAPFDGDDPLRDACRGATLENLRDEPATGPGLSAPGPSVTERFGSARVFEAGQYVRSMGPPMDYSGDFTVQFWARFAERQSSPDAVPYADAVDAARGGVAFVLAETAPILDAVYNWDDGSPPGMVASGSIQGAPARDGNWHFYRLSRNAGSGSISFCIDSAMQGSDSGPAAFDMTSNQPPHLGRDVSAPAQFDGSLDEVRIFRRALPCSVAP